MLVFCLCIGLGAQEKLRKAFFMALEGARGASVPHKAKVRYAAVRH